MKNTLTINTMNECKCDCIDSVNDDSNSLFLHFLVDCDVEIRFSDGTIEKVGTENNMIEIKENMYLNNDVYFTVNDTETITIKKPTSEDGDMLLKQVDDYTYQLVFYKKKMTGSAKLAGVITMKEGEINKYRLPLSMTEDMFPEIAKMLGFNYDPYKKLMYKGTNTSYGFKIHLEKNEYLDGTYDYTFGFRMYWDYEEIKINGINYLDMNLTNGCCLYYKKVEDAVAFGVYTESNPRIAFFADNGTYLESGREEYVFAALPNDSSADAVYLFPSRKTNIVLQNKETNFDECSCDSCVALAKAIYPREGFEFEHLYFMYMYSYKVRNKGMLIPHVFNLDGVDYLSAFINYSNCITMRL